jgi:ubiquinol-cytochrome c reductase cytochrome b subunit
MTSMANGTTTANGGTWAQKALGWVDDRFPLTVLWKSQIAEYYAPKNMNFWYFFGSLSLLVLVNQIVTGIFLTMNYKPDANLAFASVEYIMREVAYAWLTRYLHSPGASAFFIVVYLHMFRALLYGSYRKPRELTWIFGCLIFLCLMAEGFFGYLLPWGQMSYWGAQVIVNLFAAIPVIGPDLAIWIRGDYVIGDATLNRFFAFHVIAVPLVLIGLVAAHLMALHETGSNNPDGVEIKKQPKDPATGLPLDGIYSHPLYSVKDVFGMTVFLLVFSIIVFFAPEMGGYFLEYNNFIPADPLKTPAHIAPVWYFTPYYSILRATTTELMYVLAAGLVVLVAFYWREIPGKLRPIVLGATAVLLAGFFLIEAKVWGVVLMGASVLIFFLLPWLDRAPVKSIRYKGPLYKSALAIFVVAFLVLGYLGTQAPTELFTRLAQVGTLLYFGFFVLMPWYSKIDSYKPEPARVTK